jgi:competence protein ComEC
MRLAALAFATGVAGLQQLADLPAPTALWAAAALGAVLVGVGGGRLWTLVPALALLGFGWAGLLAQLRLADALPSASEGIDIQVTGVVASLPQGFEQGLRFDFDVERSEAAVPRRIALSWYRGRQPAEDDEVHGALPVAAGERWQLTVRLKRPHGSLNPHGFDYEAWLFERGIRATGYVRRADGNRRLDALVLRPGYLVERLREGIRERYRQVLADAPYGGVLVALAIGDQRAVAPELWRVYARTGVTHLLSVSGLHVTMVAGLVAWMAGWLWRRSPRFPLQLPAQKAAAAAGFLAALAYCLLAGFAIPAQRTLYMLAVVALALWTGRNTSASRVLALALLAVLLLDPWAVLAAGFWLSFGAVGLLFYAGSGRIAGNQGLAAWWRAQWAVTIGLMPALLALFQQFSLVSPLANAVAIPVVSLLITPLALLGMLPLADPSLLLAHWLTGGLMDFLKWLAGSDWAVWQQPAPPGWAVALALVGVVWMLLPRGTPARWLAVMLFLPLLLTRPVRPVPGEMLVRVLDVGQGLAVHIQSAGHDLLYDAGPAYSADANSGDRILVPYLRAVGVSRLDKLVISHADKDHEGGALAVLAAVPTEELLTSVGAPHPLATQPVPRRACAEGQEWQWDGLRFRILHPRLADYEDPYRSNAMSCVIRIEGAFGSLLLTGDIEAGQEAELAARHGGGLAADLLIPPHHGSRGASSAGFIAAVQPRLVVFSAGHRNRFGHPAPEVAARYEAAGSRIWRTDRDGAVTLRLGAAGVTAAGETQEARRYWHQR